MTLSEGGNLFLSTRIKFKTATNSEPKKVFYICIRIDIDLNVCVLKVNFNNSNNFAAEGFITYSGNSSW